jgi:hypothetical protein
MCLDPCLTGRRVRKEINDLQQWELNLYAYAVYMMRITPGQNGQSLYENFVQHHVNEVWQGHHGANFLPWHRQFLYEFETVLQWFAPVTVPFWDWTKPVPGGGGLMTNQRFTLDPSVLRFGGGNGGNIPGDPFNNFWSRVPFFHNVQRNFAWGGQAPYAFLSRANLDVLTRVTKTNFNTFSNYLESIHGTPHVAIGGDMRLLTQSSNDPLFWSHHAFIDKIWREWQVEGGNGDIFDGVQNNPWRTACLDCEPMRPFGRTVRQILSGISVCVTYQETSTRPAIFRPASRIVLGTSVRQTGSANKAGCVQLESQNQKKQLLDVIANEKISSPCDYRNRVLNASKVRMSTISATKFNDLPQYIVDSALKSFDTIQLLLKVNINDTNGVANMSDEEIKRQGYHEKQLIASGKIPDTAKNDHDVKTK